MFGILEDGPLVGQFVTLPDEQPPPDTITASGIPTANKDTSPIEPGTEAPLGDDLH